MDWTGLRLVMASAISVLVIAESAGAYELCPLWILPKITHCYVCILLVAPDRCISPNPLQAGTCLSWPADPTCLPTGSHTEFLSVLYWGQVGGTVGAGGALGALMRKLHTDLPDTWSLSF